MSDLSPQVRKQYFRGGIFVPVVFGWLNFLFLYWFTLFLERADALHHVIKLVIVISWIIVLPVTGWIMGVISAAFWFRLSAPRFLYLHWSYNITFGYLALPIVISLIIWGWPVLCLLVFLIPLALLLIMLPLWRGLEWGLKWWPTNNWRELIGVEPFDPFKDRRVKDDWEE